MFCEDGWKRIRSVGKRGGFSFLWQHLPHERGTHRGINLDHHPRRATGNYHGMFDPCLGLLRPIRSLNRRRSMVEQKTQLSGRQLSGRGECQWKGESSQNLDGKLRRQRRR